MTDLASALPVTHVDEFGNVMTNGETITAISAPASVHDGVDEYNESEIEHEVHVDEKRQIVTTIVR